MTDAIAAEWYKLRTACSTAWILAVVAAFVVLSALSSWYLAHYWDGLSPRRREEFDAPSADQPLSVALPVCAVVLGALTVTSEYATGMIGTSVAVLPRRRLYAAKALVAAGVMLTAAAAGTAVAVLAGRAIVGGRPVPVLGAPLADGVPHLLLTGPVAAAFTLIAFGLGAVLRSTAATITTMVAQMVVLPTLTGLLPSPYGERIWSALPEGLAEQIAAPPGVSAGPGVLSAPVAAAVLLVYVAVALGAGRLSFLRRDA
ncbi:ABC transporter permease [Actinomadura roseirufa]|uniref:ABC transporter permease n=1 Tax=Actinomadura roseirufa TaxID=2094049 RepID=UPI00104107C8|nr:ABC transporter permease [Actinomadura roseirufa]